MPNVLVIEDEFIVSLTLKVQLEALGCEVVGTARDGQRGVEKARDFAGSLDLIIVDIGLPGLDGIQAIREMRQIDQLDKTTIVVSTSYGDDRVKEALEAGATLALAKPVSTEQLKELVSSLFKRRGRKRGH